MSYSEHSVRKENADGSRGLAVDLVDVSKVYDTGAGAFVALADAHLTIGRGEFVAVVGKSGSGKSTLLNMITAIDRPTKGIVRVNNTVLDDMSENAVAQWRGLNVGLVFQFQQLMPTLTISENVIMPMDFVGTVPPRDRHERAMSLLDLVGVADQADKFPSGLSGGQQQRAAIARALANDPPIIAADEPTGNLDSDSADAVLQLFGNLANNGKTVVMVTHERDVESIVDRVVTVVDGMVDGGLQNSMDVDRARR